MNEPAASSGVSSFVLGRHSVLDTESRIIFWIPACAGMTNSPRVAGDITRRDLHFLPKSSGFRIRGIGNFPVPSAGLAQNFFFVEVHEFAVLHDQPAVDDYIAYIRTRGRID